jgi:hypothetical protein
VRKAVDIDFIVRSIRADHKSWTAATGYRVVAIVAIMIPLSVGYAPFVFEKFAEQEPGSGSDRGAVERRIIGGSGDGCARAGAEQGVLTGCFTSGETKSEDRDGSEEGDGPLHR